MEQNNKEYKRVPFDIVLAKKIQAGEVEGKITTNAGNKVTILTFDRKYEFPIVALVKENNTCQEILVEYTILGACRASTFPDRKQNLHLVIDIPQETRIPKFNLNDKVTFDETICGSKVKRTGKIITVFWPSYEQSMPSYEIVYDDNITCSARKITICYEGCLELCVDDKLPVEGKYVYEFDIDPRKTVGPKVWDVATKVTVDGKVVRNRCGKTCFDVPEKHEFKPFDKVLVRRSNDYSATLGNYWTPAYYQAARKEPGILGETVYLASGILWKDCLPYEGNEHLIGTTDNP